MKARSILLPSLVLASLPGLAFPLLAPVAATRPAPSETSSQLPPPSQSSSVAPTAATTPNSDALPGLASRRRCVLHAPLAFLLFPDAAIAAGAEEGGEQQREKRRGVVTLTVTDPGDQLGLEVYQTSIGSPPRPVIAVRKVVSTIGGRASNSRLQPGMVCRDFEGDVAALRRRLKEGPYPVEIQFENLAAGGDAFDDLGRPIVTAQDALQMAQQQSQQPQQRNPVGGDGGGAAAAVGSNSDEYSITVLKSPPADCTIQSRRNDLLEIRYEARVGRDGAVYDSSASRGTGQPYQTVLGSYDVIPGVDQGLYDMCPGERRRIVIPPRLAYGSRGNRLFRIPPDSTLVWDVELVSVNSAREGDGRTRDEIEGRVEY